jgi:hypothetical protein
VARPVGDRSTGDDDLAILGDPDRVQAMALEAGGKEELPPTDTEAAVERAVAVQSHYGALDQIRGKSRVADHDDLAIVLHGDVLQHVGIVAAEIEAHGHACQVVRVARESGQCAARAEPAHGEIGI